jgi:hypothetical protein
VEKQIDESQASGRDWILLENFEHARDKEILLRHHARLEDEFHTGYRLWIITQECQVQMSPLCHIFSLPVSVVGFEPLISALGVEDSTSVLPVHSQV